MPKYDYRCRECDGWTELTHSMSDCDLVHTCSCGGVMYRIPAVTPVYFFGPGFSCNDGVGRGNVGRNPNNQTRYS